MKLKRFDRIISVASGGAFLGVLLAGIPGAFIGLILAAIYSYNTLNTSEDDIQITKSHRKNYGKHLGK